jgi:hypothetical protein
MMHDTMITINYQYHYHYYNYYDHYHLSLSAISISAWYQFIATILLYVMPIKTINLNCNYILEQFKLYWQQ